MSDFLQNSELDRKLRERYENYSVQPDATVWKGVSENLTKEELLLSRKRILWLKAASIFFGLGFMTLLAKEFLWNGSNDGNIQPAYQTETQAQIGRTPESQNSISELNSKDANPQNTDTPEGNTTSLNGLPENTDSHRSKNYQTSQSDSYHAALVMENEDSISSNHWNEIDDRVVPLNNKASIVSIPESDILSSLLNNNKGILPVNASDSLHTFLKSPEEKTQVSKKALGKWFIDVYGAPVLTSRTLSTNPEFAKATSLNKSYFNSREKSQLGWSYGVSVGYALSPKIVVTSGLNISTHQLKFQTDGNYLVKTSDTEYLLYTSFGGIALSLEGDEISQESIIKSSIALSYISLPIGIEYKILPLVSMSFNLNFRYLYSQELNWESSDAADNNNQSIRGLQGIRSGTIGFSIGVVKEQPLFKRTSLLINPVFQSNLMAVSKEGPVKAYPNSIGIRIGIRKYL